jgi:NADH-quinone oxidoreductase subunit L
MWYLDDLYHRFFVQPVWRLSVFVWRVVDEGIIDATVNGVATGIAAISQWVRRVQTGLVTNYALGIALGMVVLVGAYLAIFSDLFQ